MTEIRTEVQYDIVDRSDLGAPGERKIGGGPLPVVKDIVALAGRLSAERERVLTGANPCCVAVCKPDLVSGWSIEEIVRDIADRFANSLRAYDSIFLYGRDKIIVCMPHIKQGDARLLLGRLRDLATERPIPMPTGTTTLITVSVGGVMMDRFTKVQETIDRAERAMDLARVAGGNRVGLWTADMY